MPVCGRFRKSPQAEPDRITEARIIGSPEMNFVAYKRNLIKRALATVQYKKTVPTAESYPIKI